MKIILFFCILLCAGCVGMQHPDLQVAEKLRQEAEALIVREDYTAAAERLAAAIRQDPFNCTLYLRQGELLERNDRPDIARRNYQAGLKKVSTDDPRRPELVHRLALLLTLKLDAAGESRALLLLLPVTSARHDDLQGVLTSLEGNQREALRYFNAALAQNPDEDLTATILYHAALAYHHLGDEKNTSGSLYYAINTTRNLGIAWDVENLWNRLKTGAQRSN